MHPPISYDQAQFHSMNHNIIGLYSEGLYRIKTGTYHCIELEKLKQKSTIRHYLKNDTRQVYIQKEIIIYRLGIITVFTEYCNYIFFSIIGICLYKNILERIKLFIGYNF